MFDAMKYLGIPYLRGGRSFEGADCWGLIELYYKDVLETTIPDHRRVNEGSSAKELLRASKTAIDSGIWKPIDRKPRVHDVVLMYNLNHINFIGHAGVIVAPGKMLHTEEHTGTVIMPIKHPAIHFRIAGVYQYVG